VIVDQGPEVVQADELDARAEGVLLQHAVVQRLRCRPEEEHQDDGHLRCDQHPGQPPALEADALFYGQAGLVSKI
jgi:hypothetical protein